MLSPQQIQRFQDQGVLIAPQVLTDADLAPVIDEINTIVDRRARELKEQGKITDLHEDKNFHHRIAYLHRQCKEIVRGLDIMQMRGRKMFEFLLNDHLLDALEQLLGPEITCSPIQHLRAKIDNPDAGQSGGNFPDVPWHQDAGVTWDEADQSLIVTCWIALVDATRLNGCMEIIPGVHKGGYLDHQLEGGTMIRPEKMPGVEPICAECPKNSIIFMSQFTPHRGLSNRDPGTSRWSLDLRYQKTGTPTGRPFQPDFIVRSRDASKVMRDYDQWCKMWDDSIAQARTNPQPAHRPAKRALAAGVNATSTYQA